MKPRVRIHPAFWLVIMIGFFTETLFRMLSVYLCLLIHEAGHGAAAYGFKARVSQIKIMPFGIAMHISMLNLGNRERLLISLAGPFFSIIAGLLFKNPFLKSANLALGIFNLLPAKTLDGGAVFSIFMSRIFGSIRSYNIVRVISCFISALILAIGVYAVYITRFNISLILVSVFLIYSLASGNNYSRTSAHLTAVDYRRKRSKHGIYRAKQIAVSENLPLRKILPQISEGRLCIINILDADSRIVSSISEQTAVDIMLTHGANASFASARKGEFK